MNKDFQTIAIDFDETLYYSKWSNLGELNRPLIDYLISQKEQGAPAGISFDKTEHLICAVGQKCAHGAAIP